MAENHETNLKLKMNYIYVIIGTHRGQCNVVDWEFKLSQYNNGHISPGTDEDKSNTEKLKEGAHHTRAPIPYTH